MDGVGGNPLGHDIIVKSGGMVRLEAEVVEIVAACRDLCRTGVEIDRLPVVDLDESDE